MVKKSLLAGLAGALWTLSVLLTDPQGGSVTGKSVKEPPVPGFLSGLRSRCLWMFFQCLSGHIVDR